MKHYCLYQAEELMFLGEAEDADRATDEDIPGTDVKFLDLTLLIRKHIRVCVGCRMLPWATPLHLM